MDDQKYGKRDKRGNWRPDAVLEPAPLFVFPPRPLEFLKWLPHYFLPWNVLFMLSALVAWRWLTPDQATLKSLAPGWIALLLVRNIAAVILLYGALELRLYIQRAQGQQFKYNAKWPSESPSNTFWFSNQTLDNMLRTLGMGVPLWTAYEVVILWIFANGWVPWLHFATSPIWLACFGLILPILHEVHFYCIHRLIHVPVLYKYVHSVHHNSINPSPWSSLSMHPIELLLYFSGSLIHLIVPSHPLLALYHLHLAGLGAVVGHIGFDKIVVGEETAMDTHTYAHYLHHKYFEVNYADGLVPLDRMFGTFHDGSNAAEEAMNRRFLARKAKG
jgi:sterol desaturase/sphingolipid hydroxylase (fatty acid hydroxylase superfamily)